jgi:hypothetical protein
MRGGSLAFFGGSSFLTSGGGFVAQVAGHAGTVVLLVIYGSAGLIAAVGSITAIVKVLAERSPEVRKASALAKIAKKRSDQDGGTILLLDRCLDKEGSNTSQVLQVLNVLRKSGREDTDDSARPPNAGKTGQNVVSIYTQDKEGRASNLPELPHSRPVGYVHP